LLACNLSSIITAYDLLYDVRRGAVTGQLLLERSRKGNHGSRILTALSFVLGTASLGFQGIAVTIFFVLVCLSTVDHGSEREETQ